MGIEHASNPSVSSDAPDTDTIERINQAVLSHIYQLVAQGHDLLGEHLDHGHCNISSHHRWTEDAELLEYGISYDLMLCPPWVCGEQDDNGVAAWSKSPHSGRLTDRQGRKARSEEELATVAIQKVCTDAKVWNIPENDGSVDLAIRFAKSRASIDALIEVTMHTDSGKRMLGKASRRQRFGELLKNWDIGFMDRRGVGSYDNVNAFSLKKVPAMLVDTLRQAEENNVDDVGHIAQACEEAIAHSWPQSDEAMIESERPLMVIEVASKLAEGNSGSIWVSVAPLTFNFRNVVDMTDLKSAIQARIDAKLVKDQWGDTEKKKWLVVILDDTEAATQLLGDAFEFEDHTPDFSDLQFHGLDEVWAVTFNDNELTILRFIESSAQWQHYARIPVT